MNLLSVVFLSAVMLLAVLMVSRMSYAILSNFYAGRQFRRALAERVRRLRLNRMLERRGISPDHYLHHWPVIDIERHVRACEGCDGAPVCDKALASSRTTVSELAFCPNDTDFNAYVHGPHTVTPEHTPAPTASATAPGA